MGKGVEGELPSENVSGLTVGNGWQGIPEVRAIRYGDVRIV